MDNAISDTCRFAAGAIVGVILNYIFKWYESTYMIYENKFQTHYLIIGLFQIWVNAVILQMFRDQFQTVGLFMLGMLSFQSLLIKKLL